MMCGYFGNLHECPAVIDLLNQLEIPLPYPEGHFYQRRPVNGLIVPSDNGYRVASAMWWYSLRKDGEKMIPNEKITSFNARDLDKPLWKNAIRERRGVVFATEIGESLGKTRHLMRSDTGLALGTVYKHWGFGPHGDIMSMAVITREAHPRFSRYHDKSTPLFLPLDAEFMREWLNPEISTSDAIESVLEKPRILSDLSVTPVKTYKQGEAVGETEILEKDTEEN